MPKDTENQHSQATPHFDGPRESIINDSTASAGESLGIYTQTNTEFGMEKSPFKFTPKKDPMMERFEKLMRGTKKE